MDELTPLDAIFLDAEDEDRHASLAIASVAVLEGPAPSQAAFVRAVRGRLPLVPRYRQKVRQVPFDLGPPVWVDDPAFDLGYHLRRTALPAPGDEQALCRLVARLMSQRLDRDRPLWEDWLIEGLAGGRWAVLSKMHHSVADGVSGNELYRLVFDESPEPGPPVPDSWHPAAEPSDFALTTRALAELARNPIEQLDRLVRAVRTPTLFAHQLLDTARGLVNLAGSMIPVPGTSLSGPIGRSRRFSVARAPLADMVFVAKSFHVTVNDVVLAAVTAAFRALLLERGEDPAGQAVRTLVPVSVRARGDEGVLDNQVSLMLPVLPVEESDPVARLTAAHSRLVALKAGKEAEAGAAMTSLARHEPFGPVNVGIRLAAHVPQRNVVTVITNVPGPPRPLYLLGRPVREILPYVPIADRVRVGVSVMTYDGQASFGITGDFDSTPEVGLLARTVESEIAALVRCAGRVGVRARAARS